MSLQPALLERCHRLAIDGGAKPDYKVELVDHITRTDDSIPGDPRRLKSPAQAHLRD